MKDKRNLYITILFFLPLILHFTIILILDRHNEDLLYSFISVMPIFGTLVLLISVISFLVMYLLQKLIGKTMFFLPAIIGILLAFSLTPGIDNHRPPPDILTSWLFLPLFYSTAIYAVGLFAYEDSTAERFRVSEKTAIRFSLLIPIVAYAIPFLLAPLEDLVPAKHKVNTPFLLVTLEDYVIPEEIVIPHEFGEVEFDSLKVALPFKIDSESVYQGDNHWLGDGEDGTRFFICNSVMDWRDVPREYRGEYRITSDNFFGRAISHATEASSPKPGYSTVVEYLNTTPRYSRTGALLSSESEMSSPAVRYKLGRYRFTEDATVKRVIFDNSDVNGIMYLMANKRLLTIYEGEAVKYILVLDEERQNGADMDYILQSVNSQL